MVAVSVEGFTSYAPCPRAVLTVTGLGSSQSVVSVWRISDGVRASVAGARRLAVTDAAFITDYYVPFARNVSYEVEVLSGPDGPSRTQSNIVVVDPGHGCLTDPLMPAVSVPIMSQRNSPDDVYLRAGALSEIDRPADVQRFNIMGSREPMALFGPRLAAQGLDTSVSVRSGEQNRRMLELVDSSANFLFRPHPSWGVELPGVMFLANASAVMQPVTTPYGGDLTWWSLKSDVVSAPTLKPLTGGVTFGDVAMFYSTFQAKHDAVVAAASAAGEQPTFLFDLMNPLG